MTESAAAPVHGPEKPAFVIIAAILNFIMCGGLFLALLFSGFVLLFGNLFGLIEFMSNRMTQTYPELHMGLGINVLMSIAFAVLFCFFIFYLWLGIGLLRGQKLAWYIQVGMSLFGLLGFPMGTIVNATILVFFFQPSVRQFFKA